MGDGPEPRYAKNGDVHIAFQVFGAGPVDLVYTPGIWSNLDVMWEWPSWARYLDRLAAFSRLILFDMRGVGLSDRGGGPPTLELQMDDVRAVMDAAGSEDAVIFGGARGAAMTMLFAASCPERTRAPDKGSRLVCAVRKVRASLRLAVRPHRDGAATVLRSVYERNGHSREP